MNLKSGSWERKALVLEPTVSRPRMVSGNFGAESRTESSDHRRACGQTKSAAKLTSSQVSGAARSAPHPGQRHTLEALRQPDRTRGVPDNLSSWSGGVRWTLSSRSDHSYSTTRATGGVVPASSKHTQPVSVHTILGFVLHGPASTLQGNLPLTTAHASDAQHSDSLIALINLTD